MMVNITIAWRGESNGQMGWVDAYDVVLDAFCTGDLYAREERASFKERGSSGCSAR